MNRWDDLDAAWRRLPRARLGRVTVRRLDPLVESVHVEWLESLGEAAWGYLEDCGWQQTMDDAGPVLDARGRVRPAFTRALRAAAAALAEAGTSAGPEGDPQRWASWICHALTEPHAVVRSRTA